MNTLLAFLAVSLYFGAICFVTTGNIYIALATLIIFFMVFAFLVNPLVKRSLTKKRKGHELFHFINHFIISLAVTLSIDQAFNDSVIDIKGEFKEVVDSIDMMTTSDKLTYLRQYFESDLYQVFLSIVMLFQEEGGDLLEMSSTLLTEATKNEEKQNATEGLEKKSIVQFSSMWFLSTLILAFLRFGLANFYDTLTTNVPYLLTATAYFAIAIASFYVYARVFTREKQSLERKESYEKERENAPSF